MLFTMGGGWSLAHQVVRHVKRRLASVGDEVARGDVLEYRRLAEQFLAELHQPTSACNAAAQPKLRRLGMYDQLCIWEWWFLTLGFETGMRVFDDTALSRELPLHKRMRLTALIDSPTDNTGMSAYLMNAKPVVGGHRKRLMCWYDVLHR